MRTPRSSSRVTADGTTPLGAVLGVVFCASLGTGVFWNAISFVALHGYGFGQARNFLLFAVMGAVYAAGAVGAGRIQRRCAVRIGPRGLLAGLLLAQALLCLGPVVSRSPWTLWIVSTGVSFTSSILWPVVESYLTAGRHGTEMRRAIGRFNLVWMSAVAVPLLAMPPILAHHSQWAIGAMAGVNLAALVPLAAFAPRPGHHAPETAARNVTAEYPLLLGCARVLLPLSYVLLAALGPLLPYRLEEIGVSILWKTPAAATWMVVRVLALVVMVRVTFWHGRWGTLVLAALAMAGGFAAVVLAPDLPLLLAGFAAFGVGIGMVYHTALYYAMAVGRAEVDAGGTHEALIGAGYMVGPLAGLLGSRLATTTVLGETFTEGQAIVGIVWALVGVGAIAALRPYLRARRARRGSSGP